MSQFGEFQTLDIMIPGGIQSAFADLRERSVGQTISHDELDTQVATLTPRRGWKPVRYGGLPSKPGRTAHIQTEWSWWASDSGFKKEISDKRTILAAQPFGGRVGLSTGAKNNDLEQGQRSFKLKV